MAMPPHSTAFSPSSALAHELDDRRDAGDVAQDHLHGDPRAGRHEVDDAIVDVLWDGEVLTCHS
jgi:hypothetical protein